MTRRSLLNIVLWMLFIAGLLGIGCSIFQIGLLTGYLNKTAYNISPLQQENPFASMHILFLGDSTAVGTGADCQHHSVAGYFAKDFPQASITNFSRNGRTLHELLNEWQAKAGDHYQLAVIQVGGNDILRFTPMNDVRKDLPVLLARAKAIADHVVILHSGNVGIVPVFIWPFNWWMTQRTMQLRSIYSNGAKQAGVIYVDLFRNLADDPMIKNVSLFYSPDHLHPSGAGYHQWYEQIRASLRQAEVRL